MRMEGLRCLVIGGGGAGIGRAITRAYADAGASVAVADVDAERAAVAAADVRAAGRLAYALTSDVRSADDVDAMVNGAAEAFDGLHVLATVVGGQVAFVPAVRLHEMSDADWDLAFDVNLRYVARAAGRAPRLPRSGHGRGCRRRGLRDGLHGRARAGRVRRGQGPAC